MPLSQTHEDAVDNVCKEFKCNKTPHIGTYGYQPDAVDEHSDYEIEIVLHGGNLKKKIDRWNNGKRKILIIKPSKYPFDLFDEIWFNHEDVFVKIK